MQRLSWFGHGVHPAHRGKYVLYTDAMKIVAALKLVEWVEYNDPEWGTTLFCAVCRRDKKYGHHESCDLATVLREVKEGNEQTHQSV